MATENPTREPGLEEAVTRLLDALGIDGPGPEKRLVRAALARHAARPVARWDCGACGWTDRNPNDLAEAQEQHDVLARFNGCRGPVRALVER